jgi:biopolymer transport protein ExbD
MRLPPPRPVISPAVPFSAWADITMLLAVFFLLSTSFAPERDTIALPHAPRLNEALPGAACLIVHRKVSASAGEELTFRFSEKNGEIHDLSGPEAIYFEASRIVDSDPERTFLLRIDAGVRFAVVDDVLETLRKAGVRNVVFGARPDETGGA